MTPFINSFQLSICLALIANAATGIVVYRSNSRSVVNQYFFAMTAMLTTWLACLVAGSLATTGREAMPWIRQSSAVALLMPLAFNFLRLSLKYRDHTWRQIAGRCKGWALLVLGLAALCQTDFFLVDATIPLATPIAQPVYGSGIIVYLIYAFGSLAYISCHFTRDLRESSGIHRTELQFTLLACITMLALALILAFAMPAITGELSAWVPLSCVALDGIIAYGIVTRRIMGVSDVLRSVTAYTLLSGYLVGLYIAVWKTVSVALVFLPDTPEMVPYLLAALALAFSLAPAQGKMQEFANRLFINVRRMDVGATITKATEILESITTVDALLEQFSGTVSKAIGTDRILIFVDHHGRLRRRHPLVADDTPAVLCPDSAIACYLAQEKVPLSADVIQRSRKTPLLAAAGKELLALNAQVAVGISLKGRLKGVMLVGRKVSGRVYTAIEQDALQALCNQLAVAIENSSLYTELQKGKVYNEMLLENLVSGVIAANAGGIITVFNREAQKITHIDAAEVLGANINVLPKPLAHALRHTQRTGQGLRDKEFVFEGGATDGTHITLGSALFQGTNDDSRGSLVVFDDITMLKKLEQQIQRSDRLSSLGTLSAGMAHEIKNPLVAIKTFTQLLPERYDDPDFRTSFSSLVGPEVERIDKIVNELLAFARPGEPNLVLLHLHEVIDECLKLFRQQLKQQSIDVKVDVDAENDLIYGDRDLLKQVLINFFLNAIQAMAGGGTLTLSTDNTPGPMAGDEDANDDLTVRISDTGHGIAKDQIDRIFDPFFTTKSEGTGLGLSVVHRIIQEHGGAIDVDSEVGEGTTFRVSCPVVHERVPA